GVFPVLPTPFDASGAPDVPSLRRLVKYLLRCGVDGMTFPGVASEVSHLTIEERLVLTQVVLAEVAGRVPVIAGGSSNDMSTTLFGVFGGAGGRYITDELRRGAAGTMPAIELAEVHVALFAAHRAADHDRVRRIFTRMLPVLNVQAVFRWSLTKYVLERRGLI